MLITGQEGKNTTSLKDTGLCTYPENRPGNFLFSDNPSSETCKTRRNGRIIQVISSFKFCNMPPLIYINLTSIRLLRF
jgi:hypothetical protein